MSKATNKLKANQGKFGVLRPKRPSFYAIVEKKTKEDGVKALILSEAGSLRHEAQAAGMAFAKEKGAQFVGIYTYKG